jgi:hypothetical protein
MATGPENDALDHHLGLRPRTALIVDPQPVRALVDQRPQPRVRRRVGIHDDPFVLQLAPAARRPGDRLERHSEAQRGREGHRRLDQVHMRVPGQRLARRRKRSLLDALDRRDLSAVENEDSLEQHARLAGLLAADAVALLDGNGATIAMPRSPFLTANPSRSHVLNPATNVASGRASATSSWLDNDNRASRRASAPGSSAASPPRSAAARRPAAAARGPAAGAPRARSPTVAAWPSRRPPFDLGPARCGPGPSPPHPRTGANMGRPGRAARRARRPVTK